MAINKRNLGNQGEDIAVDYLQKNGFKIINRNYHLPIGEIDIIAQKEKTLYFIEVKTRFSDFLGTPLEAITPAKRNKLFKLAEWYITKEKPKFKEVAVSAIGISLASEKPEILFIENIE